MKDSDVYNYNNNRRQISLWINYILVMSSWGTFCCLLIDMSGGMHKLLNNTRGCHKNSRTNVK